MSGIITVTTRSGGQYEIDPVRQMYRKSVTTNSSRVGVLGWQKYHYISEWQDDGRNEIEPDEIRVGYSLEFSHPEHWNVTSKVVKVEVAE